MARTPEPTPIPNGAADLTRIFNQARGWWTDRPAELRRRLILGGVLVAGAAAIFALIFSRNPMTVVYANLSAADAGQITQALQTEKIPYQLQGTTVLVPQTMADQARVDLAMQGLPKQGTVGYSNVLSNMGLGMTSEAFNLAVLDALQADLETTIDSIQGVHGSTVFINMPQQTVFVGQTAQRASASVFVSLESGYSLSPHQVYGIEELVAHSVPGLTPAQISVTNQNGDLLSATSPNGNTSTVTGQAGGIMSSTVSFEQNLDKEIMALLTPIAGSGNVVVQTNAVLDFSQTQTQSTTFQPLATGQGVPVSDHIIKETFTGTGTPPTVAGTGSNSVPTYPTGSTSGNNNLNYTEDTINYDVTKINQTVTSQPFTVKGLTVSVTLNSSVYHLTPANKAALLQLVATAIGYTNTGTARQDITIFASPFTKAQVPVIPPGPTSLPPYALPAVVGVVLLVLGFLVIRTTRREPSFELGPLLPPPVAWTPPKADPRRDRAEDLAKNNPEEMAQLVRTWLGEDARDRAKPRP